MKHVVVKTFGDLLKGHTRGEIHCLYTGEMVRQLSLDVRGNVVLNPMSGPTLVISPKTPLKFEPWVMDRGSLIFHHEDIPNQPLKLCGEGDTIRYEDGTESSIIPDLGLEVHPHKVKVVLMSKDEESSKEES